MLAITIALAAIVLFLGLTLPLPARATLSTQFEIVSEETTVKPVDRKKIVRRKTLTAFACLLVGMCGTAAYKALKNGNTSFEGLTTELVLTALVSPIVFRATLSGIGGLGKADWSTIILSSYQNGFFWEVIFGEIRAQVGSS